MKSFLSILVLIPAFVGTGCGSSDSPTGEQSMDSSFKGQLKAGPTSPKGTPSAQKGAAVGASTDPP